MKTSTWKDRRRPLGEFLPLSQLKCDWKVTKKWLNVIILAFTHLSRPFSNHSVDWMTQVHHLSSNRPRKRRSMRLYHRRPDMSSMIYIWHIYDSGCRKQIKKYKICILWRRGSKTTIQSIFREFYFHKYIHIQEDAITLF